MIDRIDRVEKLLMREISYIIQQEINDSRVRAVTIMRVEVTRDLRVAKIFCVITADEADEQEKKSIIRALRKASSFIRGELSKRISLKFMPRLSFAEDSMFERQRTVDMIFRKIEDEKPADDSPEE